MRVLYIADYSPYEKVKKGLMPSQHLFGFNELKDKDIHVTYKCIHGADYKGNIFLELLHGFYRSVKYSFCGYDIIFDAIPGLERSMGILKKLGILRQKYVCVMHHPPFDTRMKMCKYDAMLFLDKGAYDEMKEKYPKQAKYMYQNTWGPDLEFYKRYITKFNYEISNPLTFVSNGKTRRDHDLLVSASKGVNATTLIVCDEKSVPANYDHQPNVKLHFQDKPDDVKMVHFLQTCSVMVIPTLPSAKRIGCIGITSFMDALALGMPVIVGSNSVMVEIVNDYNCGLVYQAGNEESLRSCMSRFAENPSLVEEMGRNARKYAEEVNMQSYSRLVEDVLHKLAPSHA